MNERQLQSFILASDRGSFSKAANDAFISTPAFVQQINLLEQDIGFKLFRRSPKGVELTESGEMFLEKAKMILELYDRGVRDGRGLEERLLGQIRIGSDATEVAPFLPDICYQAKQENPGIKIELVETPYAQQLTRVAEGDIDLSFFPRSEALDRLRLSFTPLYRDGWVCAMSPEHPLATKECIRLEDWGGWKVNIEKTYHEEVQTKRMLAYIKENRIPVEIDQKTFGAPTPTDLLLSDEILPVPERYLSDCVPPLVAIPLLWNQSEFGLAHRFESNSAISSFIDVARRYFAERAAPAGQDAPPAEPPAFRDDR